MSDRCLERGAIACKCIINIIKYVIAAPMQCATYNSRGEKKKRVITLSCYDSEISAQPAPLGGAWSRGPVLAHRTACSHGAAWRGGTIPLRARYEITIDFALISLLSTFDDDAPRKRAL